MLKRKIKTIIIITIIVLLSSLDLISAKNLSLLGVVITIDPGHGGRDPGTMYNSIKEKDLNLEISKALEKELTKNGAIVYMIRTSDIDLSSIYDSKKKRGDLYRRLLKIKENKSNLYLSIHINWYQSSAHKGAEVLYNSINKNNKLLAEAITGGNQQAVKNVFFCESAFDAMAFYQQNQSLLKNDTALVSLGGTFSDGQVQGVMKRFPNARPFDCFDNDLAGRIYGLRMLSLLEDPFYFPLRQLR